MKRAIRGGCRLLRRKAVALVIAAGALAILPTVAVSNTYHPPASCSWTPTGYIASALGIPASNPIVGGTPGIEDCVWSLWNPKKPGWGKLTLQYVEEAGWSQSTMQGYAQQNNCKFATVAGLGEDADDAVCHDYHAKNPNQAALSVEVGPDTGGGVKELYLSITEYPYIKKGTKTVQYRPIKNEIAGLKAIAGKAMKSF
jgi:hypothetical protein